MKFLLIYLSVMVGGLGLAAYVMKAIPNPPCWCWSRDQGAIVPNVPHPKWNEYASFGTYGSPGPSKSYASYGSYGTEVDWNDPQRIIPLGYHQAQGKRVFYQQCVWCHSDTTPAGPSNRSNVTPTPPLMNNGAIFNGMSDASLQQAIALGGRATGKSAMMPPYGKSLTQDDIRDLIAYMRAIAAPAYGKTSVKGHRKRKGKPS